MSVRPMVVGGWHKPRPGAKPIRWEVYLNDEVQYEALKRSLLLDVVYVMHPNGGVTQ